MEDSRNLLVAMLAQSGNEKEVTKYFKAWAQGKSPNARPSKKEQKVTEEMMAKMRALREKVDKQKAAEKVNGGSV